LYAAVRAHHRPRAAWQIWCEGRAALLRDHPQSPIEARARADFADPSFFNYDEALRFAVEVEAVASGEAFEADLGRDGVIVMRAVGRTAGLAGALGAELTLYWIDGYGGGLFLPFADATAGGETFGGGRYVLDTIKGADLGQEGARLVVDFNFAYNPSCAYSPAWTCPLAPPGNRLPSPVRAGEQARREAVLR
jgi:uncharacterized protein (DUF1684 family)